MMAVTIASLKVLQFHEKEVAGFYPALQIFQIRIECLCIIYPKKQKFTHSEPG